MPTHMERREGNLLIGTQIQSLRMSGPLDGSQVAPAASHPFYCFVPCSVCSGGVDPTGGFYPRTLSYIRPTTIVRPILDTVDISHAVIVGTTCEESGRCVDVGLLCLIRAHRFASSVLTSRGYKVGDRPCPPLRSLTRTPIDSSLPSLCLKRERETREISGA
jgi:hypothetical protein